MLWLKSIAYYVRRQEVFMKTPPVNKGAEAEFSFDSRFEY